MRKSNLLHSYYAVNSIDGLKLKKRFSTVGWLSRWLEWFDTITGASHRNITYFKEVQTI